MINFATKTPVSNRIGIINTMELYRNRSLIYQATMFLVAMSAVGSVFFVIWALQNHSTYHVYLLWNLFLAWIPFGLSVWLLNVLRVQRWRSWLPLAITVAWLAFLPNTFYMLTDYIHLQDVESKDMVFDAVMFSTVIAAGVSLGFASLAIVHNQLRARFSHQTSWRIVGIVLFLVSFAIYIGRELRWNSWDIIINPAGILFDLSEILLRPTAHPQVFITTATFFVLLTALYYSGRHLLIAVRQNPKV